MYQSDYILRLIEQMGVLLRRIVAALREVRPDEALELTDEALELSLGMGPEVFGSLTGEGLIMLLGAGGDPDPAQALLVGEALVRRSQALAALGNEERARWESDRARAVLEIAIEAGSPEHAAAARGLLGDLDDSELGSGAVHIARDERRDGEEHEPGDPPQVE